jgi:hypothetical protein
MLPTVEHRLRIGNEQLLALGNITQRYNSDEGPSVGKISIHIGTIGGTTVVEQGCETE